jgi:hypothetical protein
MRVRSKPGCATEDVSRAYDRRKKSALFSSVPVASQVFPCAFAVRKRWLTRVRTVRRMG